MQSFLMTGMHYLYRIEELLLLISHCARIIPMVSDEFQSGIAEWAMILHRFSTISSPIPWTERDNDDSNGSLIVPLPWIISDNIVWAVHNHSNGSVFIGKCHIWYENIPIIATHTI